jgi:hypothetical protein
MVLRDFQYLSQNAYYGSVELGYTRSGLFKSNSSLFLTITSNIVEAEEDKSKKALPFKDFNTIVLKAGLSF